ncbi:hypothetical protein [Kitasatospora sp. NE20-6]|uniref:hypothetical protein n=1 Tax=Kitasatospora sp. NE20-6 TaxID=2859066 RepID=UPI0038B3C1B0
MVALVDVEEAGRLSGMSQRRSRRRSRARDLDLPLSAVGRTARSRQPGLQAPLPVSRPVPAALRPRSGTDTAPFREPATTRLEEAVSRSTRGCCGAVSSRRILEGGAIMMLTVHAKDCGIWSIR